MSSPLRAVNVPSVFWEPEPTSCLFCFFFSVYEAAPAPSSNYSPHSRLHVSDDTDKTSQPQLRHEPEVMCKYAAHVQQKYGERQEFQKFDSSLL